MVTEFRFDTVEEVEKCSEYYIQLLGLQDWKIIFALDVPSNPEWAGECESIFEEKCAKITIDNREHKELWFKQPQELVLIHELIHCKIPTINNGNMDGTVVDLFYHTLVDDWARSIYFARYGLTQKDLYFGKDEKDANNQT